MSSADEPWKPNVGSQVLFDDLNSHVAGFKFLWDDIVARIPAYLGAWNLVPQQFTDSLIEYFQYQFTEGQGVGLYFSVRADMWGLLGERESFALAQLREITIPDTEERKPTGLGRRGAGGGTVRYATLDCAADARAVLGKMVDFQTKFPQYLEFKKRVDSLHVEHQQLAGVAQRIRALFQDYEVVAVFPEECGLLGIRLN